MSIQLGGQQYSEDQIIAAIAASNDPAPFSAYGSIEEVSGVVQAVLHRLSALEDRLPLARSGFGVTTVPGATTTTHIVQCLDELGRTVKITYEIPNS